MPVPNSRPSTGTSAGAMSATRISLRILLGSLRAFDAVIRGPLDLAVRIALAQACVVSEVMAMSAGHPQASPMMSAGAMIAGGSLAGLGLSLGLFTRISAGALLGFAVSRQLGLEASEPNLFIIACLGWFVLRGPGAISLDRAFALGLRDSALPLARPVMKGLDWLRAHAAPAYLLAARIWLAAAIVGLAPESPCLPSGTFDAMPLPVRMVVGVLMVGGFALPLLVPLLIAGDVGILAFNPASGLNLYLMTLLILLRLHKGGLLTMDALVAELLHRQLLFQRPREAVPANWPHVVIVGAGFGGLACAAQLKALPVRITLVDKHNYHLFQPLLYQVATGGLSPADVATPIRGMFSGEATIAVRLGTVSGVDTTARQVMIGDEVLPYDTLVLATGARHSYFGRDEWAPFAPGLKRIEDGVMARSKVLTAFERAEAATDPAETERLLTFVIIGAGPTGVELAGALAELAHSGLADHFRNIDTARARIILVQAGDRVLPTFDATLSAHAQAALEKLGVDIRLDARVTGIDTAGVAIGDERVAAATVLWAAGVVASPAAAWLGSEADRAGRAVVDEDLSVAGHPDVFVIGDTASSLGWDGKPVPGLAPAAKQGGIYVARVIRARLQGSAPPPPFRYRHMGSLATIGRKAAVADFGVFKLSGALAWWLWGAIHVAFLDGVRNRLAVMLNWVWCYLSFRVSVQLITGDAEGGAASME